MSISKDLLEILCCPESHQPLRELSGDEIAKVNNSIKTKEIKTVAGKPIEVEIEAALLREDSKVLYPIREGIPVLLIDEGIPLQDELV